MNRKFHIKKGDLVQVNAGEDKGKQGKVLEVFPDKERAIVEGIKISAGWYHQARSSDPHL